jgi:transcriptional regulator with XRE-family HTH domain
MEQIDWGRMGKRVQAFREQMGWSQTELADRAGVSRSTVSDIERAVHIPETITFIKLTEALGKNYADLLS